MKNNRVLQTVRRHRKLLLLLMLLAVALVLSSCYVEPDRVVDDTNGLTIGTEGQNFDVVITPTPAITPSPSPTKAASIDWSTWDFSSDTATNPPSDVVPTGASGTSTATNAPTSSTATATPTTATTTTAPDSTVLKNGSSGLAVRQLQDRLKDLKYYTGSSDGKYGAATEQAVKDFQSVNNLTADGIAGTKTQDALFGKNAIAKTTSSSGSSTSTSTTSTSTNTYTNGKTNIYLRLGSTGDQVKILQNRLIFLGYLAGTADGNFAETTQAGVIAFQSRNSLSADGVAGPDTLELLYSSSAKKATSVAAYLGALRLGMNGDGVRAMQSRLKDLKYYDGSVDGDFGSGTYAAVVAFQTAKKLTPDGVAGAETLNLLYSTTSGSSSGSSSSSSSSSTATNPVTYGETATSTGYKTLSSSNSPSKTNVTSLQNSLASLGYYTGSLDGSYGSGTTTAVKNYQASHGLRVTGTAGPAMQRMLYGGTAASGSYSTLRPGDTGSDVRSLQYTLYELKFYDGQITGTYDEKTTNAVRDFQDVNNISPFDGIAGPDTLRTLYSSKAAALKGEVE